MVIFPPLRLAAFLDSGFRRNDGDGGVALNEVGKQPSLAGREDRMMDGRRLSIELPEETAEIIDARIASGRNASASEVIREALELLAEQDASLEDWVQEELAAAYDEWKANPTGAIPLEEVSARLEEERALRRAKR